MKYICNKCKAEYNVGKVKRGIMTSSTDSIDYSCPVCGGNDISRIKEEKS